jgi:hypothetical protein
MSITAAAYAKTRAEIIGLFGWDADSLTPEQTLRADCATALRLGLDELQGRLIRGESVDMAKMLVASEALSRLLPPAILAAPPQERREDPRKALFEIVMQMREREGVPAEGLSEVAALQAELAALKAGGLTARAAGLPVAPTEADVVPPSEIADRDPGPKPGPDDKPPPVTIEGKAMPAKPFVNGLSDVPQHMRDTRPANEPWRNHVKIDWQG